jgi:hypothetical protein
MPVTTRPTIKMMIQMKNRKNPYITGSAILLAHGLQRHPAPNAPTITALQEKAINIPKVEVRKRAT